MNENTLLHLSIKFEVSPESIENLLKIGCGLNKSNALY